ncbi:hypothetical protein [Cupriavidus sp. CP313]
MKRNFDIDEYDFWYQGSRRIEDLPLRAVILDKEEMRDALRDELIHRGDGVIDRVAKMTAAQFAEHCERTVEDGFVCGYKYAVRDDAVLTEEEYEAFLPKLLDEYYGGVRVWWVPWTAIAAAALSSARRRRGRNYQWRIGLASGPSNPGGALPT